MGLLRRVCGREPAVGHGPRGGERAAVGEAEMGEAEVGERSGVG